MKVVLIGPRASGKTSVGRLLAERWGVPFSDSDAVVEISAGRTVAELLADGELRRWERDIFPGLLGKGEGVVALGGGAVLWDGLAAAVRGWAVVWLDADPAVLGDRIRHDPVERPSLTGAEPAEEVAQVMRERRPFYDALADLHIDTSRDDLETIAGRINELLKTQE